MKIKIKESLNIIYDQCEGESKYLVERENKSLVFLKETELSRFIEVNVNTESEKIKEIMDDYFTKGDIIIIKERSRLIPVTRFYYILEYEGINIEDQKCIINFSYSYRTIDFSWGKDKDVEGTKTVLDSTKTWGRSLFDNSFLKLTPGSELIRLATPSEVKLFEIKLMID